MYQQIRQISIATSFVALLAMQDLAAQEAKPASDKIVFMNGESRQGKVVAFSGDRIQFIHKGETLKYEFAKAEVERIEYASGRTEAITAKQVALPEATIAECRHRVAVLPMTYIADGNASKMDNMPQLLQEMTVEFLSQAASELKFSSPAETNALLAKAGITDDNIKTFTPKELAAILRVEYLVTGTVMQDNGSVVTVEHYHSEKKKRTDRDWDHSRSRERRDSHGSSVTNQQVENQVALNIFNDNGESIYTKSRHSLISSVDGYKNTLRYLLKRTPLYQR